MLTAAHKQFLVDHAVDPRVAVAAGVRSTTKPVHGLVFPWRALDGTIVEQLRVDEPEDAEHRYTSPTGSVIPVNVHPAMDERVANPAIPIGIIEGTKQYLAACSVKTDRALVGISGCFGWSHDQAPTPSLLLPPWLDRDVVIFLDADRATNADVHEAGRQLADWLTSWGANVKHASLPGRGAKAGLDDVLATVAESARAGVFDRLWSKAGGIGKKPARKLPSGGEHRFFDQDTGLQVADLVDEILADHPMALFDEALHVYGDGVFRPVNMKSLVPLYLPQRYRMSYAPAVGDSVYALAKANDWVIPDRPAARVLNVANGLLDLDTLELAPHTPDHLSVVQLPVPWWPEATCPTYDAWILGRMGSQEAVDDLHECLGTMLDPTYLPLKTIVTYGPSRSGKSTIIRIAREVAGRVNCSAVTIHDLANNRFAPARMRGKILNTSPDLSAKEVNDTSTFRQMTGQDEISADRKFISAVDFTSSALMLFSANTIPPVGEGAAAYLERIKPFRFPNSFAGSEDPSIEARIIASELPGVLRRWVVDGLGPFVARGHRYRPTDPATMAEFIVATDRVRRWVAEETTALDAGTSKEGWAPGQRAFATFNRWATATGGKEIGRDTFYQRLRDAGVPSGRSERHKTVFALRLIPDPSDPLDASRPRTGKNLEGEKFPVREEEVPKGSEGSATGSLVFDLETADSAELWHRPDFLRIVGRVNSDLSGPVIVDTDFAAVVTAAANGATLVAHNGFAFDFVALAAHGGLDILTLGEADRLRDTAILALLADPPESRGKGDDHSWRYELSATAQRMGHEGKTDDLARLKRKHKGYDRIPVADPEYRAYCGGDVAATVHVLRSLPDPDGYARREMRLLGRLASSISVVGFRIDEGLLAVRLTEQLERVARRTAWLASEHGLPLTRKDGKPAAAPLRTKAGRPAVVAAFGALGLDVTDWPPSPKGTAPAIGKEVMLQILEDCDDLPEIVELAETVMAMNGEPVAYAGVNRHLVDGRVHPRVKARQASGRLSITDPGLTILGKRSAALLAQRDVFIADPGCVLFAVDLSQIDARAVAALSGCVDYGHIFDPGRDLHTEVAVRLWGDDVVAGAPKLWRERAKPLSHGYPYGMGVEGLARQAKLSLADAEAYVAFMLETFPRLHDWMGEVRQLGGSGELLGNGFGRGLRVTQGREHTQAPALLGQGCARDLMMEGVLRLPLEVVPMLRAIVHDELVFSAPEARFAEVRDAVVAALQFAWSPPDGSGQVIEIIAEATGPAERWGAVYG